MKAIVYHKYGSSDELKLEDVQKPAPKDDEVLIKVHAASINSWDWDRLTGRPLIYRLLSGILKPKLKIIGCDIAGRIEAVGSNVKLFQPGDEVFGDISGCGWGGFAEYVCACENVLALKSSEMSFEEAAAMPHTAVLAIQGLHKYGPIQKGQKILINGSGGGVGTFGLQIAKSYGAEVTCIDSTIKMDFLKFLGADHVIDYTREDFRQSASRYDLILDPMAHRSLLDYSRVMNPKGKYVMIGGAVKRIFQMLYLGLWISMTSNKKIGFLVHKPNREDLNALNKLYEDGKIKPIIDRSYPLSEVAEALRYFGEGQVRGKIIITV